MRRSTQPLIILSVILLVVTLGIGAYIWSVVNTKAVGGQPATGSTNTSSSNAYAVLKPATVPSKIAECQQAITYASDGNPSPVRCSNGDLNILAWDAISAQEPTVIKLGYSPTLSQLESSMCADARAANLDHNIAVYTPLEATAYELASLYYGWNFNINPRTVMNNC